MKGNDFIEVARPRDTIRAGILKSLLESKGILIYLQGEAIFGLGVSDPPLRMLVPQHKEQEAREIIDQMAPELDRMT